MERADKEQYNTIDFPILYGQSADKVQTKYGQKNQQSIYKVFTKYLQSIYKVLMFQFKHKIAGHFLALAGAEVTKGKSPASKSK